MPKEEEKTTVQVAPMSTDFLSIMQDLMKNKPEGMDELQYLTHVQTFIAAFFKSMPDESEQYEHFTQEVFYALTEMFPTETDEEE